MKVHRRLLLCALLVLPPGFAALHVAHGEPAPGLRIATWNLEWLLAPETARTARIACRDGQRPPVPCDVALELARDSADLARLAAYTRELDADVIAFQEVENAAIAQRVFPGYRICITAGSGVQQVGFAVRPPVRHRCGPALPDLAAGGRSREGMMLTLLPGNAPPIELLAVHLKSGCSRDPLDSPTAACRLLQKQAGVLGEWIAERDRHGSHFIVLGDFNRIDTAPDDGLFWQQLDPAAFVSSAAQLPYSNCAFGEPYRAYIDHILVSRSLATSLAPAHFARFAFRTRDRVRYRLADHCPLRVSLNLTGNL